MRLFDNKVASESGSWITNPANDNKKDQAIFMTVCLLLAIVKLILIGADEIIARNQPLDDLWQILAAARGYWFRGSYNVFSFVHLPVFPLWIALVHFTGIPLKIANEVAYIFGSFWLTYAIRQMNGRKIVALLIFAALVFHPTSFHLFNYCLPDTLYVSLMLISIGSLIMLWLRVEGENCWKYSLASGMFIGLLTNTRKESILIYIILAYFIFAVVLSHYKKRKHLTKVLFRSALVPIATMMVFSLAIKTANYLKFGLFVTTDMSAPGYVAAYNALLRIKPDKPMRFVPITKEVRFKAYSVSKAFRELEPLFEGQFGYDSAIHTRKYMGIENEIAAGWMYWTIKQAAAIAGHHHSAVEANNYYQRIADEINQAIDKGQLAGRRVWLKFLDPDFKNYLPYLFDSISRILNLFVISDEPVREQELKNEMPASVRAAFDIVANRRAFVFSENQGGIDGWVFGNRQRVVKVLLRNDSKQILASTDQFIARPDVANAYKGKNDINIPDSTGFSLKIENQSTQQIMMASIVFVDAKLNEFTVSCRKIITGKPHPISEDDGSDGITYAVDKIVLPKAIGQTRHYIQNRIWHFYGTITKYTSILSVLFLPIFVWIYSKKHFLSAGELFLIGLLIVVVVPRVLFFALIDASSWPGNQPRYIFPSMVSYSCLLLLVLDYIMKTIYDVFYNFRKKYRSGIWNFNRTQGQGDGAKYESGNLE